MKRKSYKIKEDILLSIREGAFSYSKLERKINTCFTTIKNSCEELFRYGLVNIEKKEKHSSNGRPYYSVSLTQRGREYAEKILKNNNKKIF